MLQRVSYLVQLLEILFLCRRFKKYNILIVLACYIIAVAIITLDRRYYSPRLIAYVAAFLIGLHYVMLTAISIYILTWLLFRNKYSTDTDLILKITVISCGVIFTIYGFLNGLITNVNKYSIETSKLDNEFRIVQISDLHICEMYNANEVGKLVVKINSLEPDIVCFTGDMFDGWRSTTVDISKVCNEFKELNSKYGTYVIYGNHDAPFTRELGKLCDESGFTYLEDDKITVDNIDIIGRCCSPNGCSLNDIGIDNSRFTIVLDHTPDRIKESSERNIDLLLCGHTHGGQLLPIKLIFDIMYGINSGSNKYDNTLVIVNQGAYLIYPFCRISGESEIVCIDINK